MRKLITVAVLFGLCLSASFAQADDKKGKGQADAERAKLLKQLAEQKRAEAVNQLKKYGGKAAFDKATYEKKLRYLLQNPSKGGKKPFNPKGHVKPGAEKLEHFRAAIKHLQAAGQKELAHAVAQHAERYQAELQKAHQHPVKGGGKGFVKGGEKRPQKNIGANLRELSSAIINLRKQMQSLQKAVEQLQKRGK